MDSHGVRLYCHDCSAAAETVQFEDLFDPYVRSTWPIAKWWHRYLRKIRPGQDVLDVALEGMPEYPEDVMQDGDEISPDYVIGAQLAV